MLKLPFHQTTAEQMVRVASTLLFNALIQSGHSLVCLSDLTEKPQYGFTASATEQPIGPKFVRITDLKDGKIDWETVPYCECTQIDNYKLSSGDILFARTGATTGKTHLVSNTGTNDAVFASYLIRLRPKSDIVSPEYLYSFFQSNTYWSQILEEKQGSAQPNVNGQRLLTLHLPIVPASIQLAISTFLAVVRNRQSGGKEELPELPHPLDEQRRIVGRIEALAGRLAEAQRLRTEAIAGVETFIESCTDVILVELASKYESHKFSQICTTITDGDHITPQYATEGIKFIFVGNVSSGHLHFNNCKYVTEEYFATISPQRIPRRGDILYSAVGATLGVPAIVDVDEPFCFQRHIAILKPDSAIVDSRFAWHLLQAGQIYRKAWSLTTGSAQPTIPLKAIRSLEIPIPPIQEQRQIVIYLDDLYARVDALKRLQTGTSAELDALLPAILDKAFRGAL